MTQIKKALVFIILTTNLVAQAQDQPQINFSQYKVDTLHLMQKNLDYYLLITLPPNYKPSEKKYPVYYYLDAWCNTTTFGEAGLSLMQNNEIRPIILVGISYKTTFDGWLKLRESDFVPPKNNQDTSKGAVQFLEFFKDAIIPFVENKYSIDTCDRTLFGYSYGGLFAAWTIKEEPNLFQKYTIASPALWYGDKFLLNDSIFLHNIHNAKNIEILVTYASLEYPPHTDGIIEFYNLLKTNKTIQSELIIFENENHITAGSLTVNKSIYFHNYNRFKRLNEEATLFYFNKNYSLAIEKLQEAFYLKNDEINGWHLYFMASCLALENRIDEAFKYLFDAVNNYPILDYSNVINTDTDLELLHSDTRWNELITVLNTKIAPSEK